MKKKLSNFLEWLFHVHEWQSHCFIDQVFSSCKHPKCHMFRQKSYGQYEYYKKAKWGTPKIKIDSEEDKKYPIKKTPYNS